MNHYEPKMRELDAVPIGYGTMFGNNTFPIHLTELQIQEAERQMGARLPDDYREFIRDFGGFAAYAAFPFPSDIYEEMGFSEFNAIVSDENMAVWDIVRNYLENYDNSDTWRRDWLHLGSTGGPSIALAFKGSGTGSICTFDAEYEPVLVARSFDEFMNLLYRREDVYLDADTAPPSQEENPFWDTFATP